LRRRYQRVLPAEALNAITINARMPSGWAQRIGSLEPGKQADLLVLSTSGLQPPVLSVWREFRRNGCEKRGCFWIF